MNTIRDRIAYLDLDYPDKHLAWAIGNLVRDAYWKQYGTLPEKGLRDKTSGKGSHCFALYPDEFLPAVDAILLRTLQSPQKWFAFDDDDDDNTPLQR